MKFTLIEMGIVARPLVKYIYITCSFWNKPVNILGIKLNIGISIPLLDLSQTNPNDKAKIRALPFDITKCRTSLKNKAYYTIEIWDQ